MGSAALVVKNPLANAGDIERCKISPWVSLPGESHGQRSPEGYSPQAHKESEMTEAT